jgi:hypothetical protein
MRLRLSLALWMVMLVTASAAAHGRVFVSTGGGVPAHRITVALPAVVVSPGFVTVSGVHAVPHAALVITPQRAIQPGRPVIVTHRSATFFPQTVLVSPPVQGAVPLRVTVSPRGVVPKVIMVYPLVRHVSAEWQPSASAHGLTWTMPSWRRIVSPARSPG